MDDLSHWDFAQEFTGQEAAALIVGIEPASGFMNRTKPVLANMERSYVKTLGAHKIDLWRTATQEARGAWISIPNSEDPFQPENLHSWRMYSYYEATFFIDLYTKIQIGIAELEEVRFRAWLMKDETNGFDHQYFQRDEITRWLEAINKKSVYEFELDPQHGEKSQVAQTRSVHFTSGRRDLLTPVIELAQTTCRNPSDASEVWAKLRSLAQSKHSPLNGIDDVGVQYLDGNDQLKNLTLRALRMRLFRAR